MKNKKLVQRLTDTMGFVVAKMQEGCSLTYCRKPYAAALFSQAGGHHRNVTHELVKRLERAGYIEKVEGNASSARGARYMLTEKGRYQ